MAAFKVKLTIYQGETFLRQFTWKTGSIETPTIVDLTGCAARMQIRSRVESPDVLLELTTENGGITLGGTAGTIVLSLPFEDTAAIDFRTGVYDLEIVKADATVRRLMSGTVRVSEEVTR
jgi:hypothetical protein